MMAAWTANAQNSPYIAHVYDYLPAPGQFVNQSPSYKPGYTQDSINALVETSLCGKAMGGPISLGSFGGYIVFGFDHPVVNKHGYDVKIYASFLTSPISMRVAILLLRPRTSRLVAMVTPISMV